MNAFELLGNSPLFVAENGSALGWWLVGPAGFDPATNGL